MAETRTRRRCADDGAPQRDDRRDVTINHAERSVPIDTTDGLRRLHAEYLDEGRMRHGCAITVHKGQGLGCDHGLLLASDEMHHEMGCAGLSRGKESNRS